MVQHLMGELFQFGAAGGVHVHPTFFGFREKLGILESLFESATQDLDIGGPGQAFLVNGSDVSPESGEGRDDLRPNVLVGEEGKSSGRLMPGS